MAIKPSEIGAIFDCDGTLIDSMAAWRKVEDQLAQAAGVMLTKKDTDLITELTIPEVGKLFYESFGVGNSPQDVVEMIYAAMGQYYAHESQLKPGVLDFIESLYHQGVKLSVASSTPQDLLVAGMKHTGIADYMTTILSVNQLGCSKREPTVYEAAENAMGTDRHFTWGFEDALYAIKTLSRAWFGTVGVYDCDLSGTYEDLSALADITIRSFEELTAEQFIERAMTRV